VIYTLVRYGKLKLAQSELDKITARLQPDLQRLTGQESKSPALQALKIEAGEVYFIGGMIAASRDDYREAVRLFQAADRYDFPARNSVQMEMLGEAFYRMGEYQLSIQAYETYAKYSPLDPDARMYLGLSYYSSAMFPRARENFQKVLEQAPKTPSVHLYLGLSLLEEKSNEEARREFLEELKSEPRSYQAMAELAYLDYLAGDNVRCGEWLEKARPLKPDWIETNMVSGLLHNRMGQFDRAIQYLELVVKEKPNHYKAHFQLALAYRRTGNESKAKEHADIYDRLIAEEKSRQLGDKRN
jgi:tetratricopeptide (TPR) repeat protein